MVVGNETIFIKTCGGTFFYIVYEHKNKKNIRLFLFIYNTSDAFDHHYVFSSSQTLNYISLQTHLSSERVVFVVIKLNNLNKTIIKFFGYYYYYILIKGK